MTTEQPSRSAVTVERLRKWPTRYALHAPPIWRKLSFGTQCDAGSRFVDAILMVVETFHHQPRNIIETLTAAMQAHLAAQTAPTPLPACERLQ